VGNAEIAASDPLGDTSSRNLRPCGSALRGRWLAVWEETVKSRSSSSSIA
jgi:hypothetical protein